MKIYNLASSSSGNSSFICTKDSKILVDVGISMKKINSSLNTIGTDLSKIDAILITHEHIDHIRSLGTISGKYKIPIYTSEDTIYEIINKSSIKKISENLFRRISSDDFFEIKDLKISPFNISHDAIHPFCFRIENDQKKIGIVTDLGCFDNYLIDNLQGLDAIVLESNHDVNMLEVGHYPFYLKKRILSKKGHLSNDASSEFLKAIWHNKLKNVILAHLSRENNLPELALKNMENQLDAFYANANKFTKIQVAKCMEIVETLV